MLFARTIRRKMIVGLVTLVVMLLTLSLVGISGLISYRNLVRELDATLNESPNRHRLSDRVAELFDLSNRPIDRIWQKDLRSSILKVENSVADYRRKLENLPPSRGVLQRRLPTDSRLLEVDQSLQRLTRMSALPETEPSYEKISEFFVSEIGNLNSHVHYLPDHQEGIYSSLREARSRYRLQFRWILWTSLLVLLVFLGLGYYGYKGVFSPLQKLHEGAVRVAQGDFDYRLKLETHDEMSELADAFNRMTSRFQEIAANLDHQVQERSKQLVRSERLACIGFLAAGVAHEINNPLSAIGMAAESVAGRFPELSSSLDDEDRAVVLQYLQMIQKETVRCQQITDKLLDFARGQGSQRTHCDLTQIVLDVQSMVQHMSKFQGRNVVFDPPGSCFAFVNGPEIKQVVLNLVANGLESMSEKGTLEISLREMTDQFALEFRDDGCGMTAEVQEHLFEPFFTQRRTGKGTGLGLSISHRIIADHEGRMEVHSDGPGKGSTFTIHLPRDAGKIEQAA